MSNGQGEKFCLRWNDFENNISKAFGELRDDKDFFDVTLACDDNQLQAHKVILSACSPFFRSILKKNPHQHPLLYLKGVKYEDIVSVLNFMYHGEVNVAQEELNSFLAVAEDLQVKGLTQNNQSQTQPTPIPAEKMTPYQPNVQPSPMPDHRTIKQQRVRPSHEQLASEPFQPKREIQMQTPQIKTEAPIILDSDDLINVENTQQVVEADVYQEDPGDYEFEQNYDVHTMQYDGADAQGYDNSTGELDFDEYVMQNTSKLPGVKSIQCLICNKVTINVGNMKQHFEVHHFHRTYTCDVCNKTCKTKNCLFVHKKTYGHNTSTKPSL